MAKNKNKVMDPVDEQVEGTRQAEMDEQMRSLDVKEHAAGEEDILSPKEIGAIHRNRVTAPHPFDGYRLGRKVQVGVDGLQVSSTHLVMLKPTEEPVPDPSNANQTIYVSKVEGGGGTPQDGKEKVVTFPTSHTRCLPNRRGTENESVVFDREVLVGDIWYKCAVVKSHAVRAQIVFEFDPNKERIMPDKRYLLADTRQAQPLLKMFEAIYYQRTKSERAARAFDNAKDVAPPELVVEG